MTDSPVVRYMEWPDDPEDWPDDNSIIMFCPMRRWGELGWNQITNLMIKENEEIEGITYEEANQQALDAGLPELPPRPEV